MSMDQVRKTDIDISIASAEDDLYIIQIIYLVFLQLMENERSWLDCFALLKPSWALEDVIAF